MPEDKSMKKNNTYDFEVILNQNFNIVIILIVLVFLALSYFLVIKPRFDATLVRIKDSIYQQQQFYNTQQQRLADLKASVALFQSLDENSLEKIRFVLPNEYAKERLFGELEDIISQQGVLVNRISLRKLDDSEEGQSLGALAERFNNIPNPSRVGVIEAEISLGAIDYPALTNLLPLLEAHLQLLDITSLDFVPDEKAVNLSLFTYYFKD